MNLFAVYWIVAFISCVLSAHVSLPPTEFSLKKLFHKDLKTQALVNSSLNSSISANGMNYTQQSLPTISWLKQFFGSDYFYDHNNLKNATSRLLPPLIEDFVKWSQKKVESPNIETPNIDSPDDDDDDEFEDFDAEDYTDFEEYTDESDDDDTDSVEIRLHSYMYLYMDQFIEYLVKHYHFKEEQLSILNDLDFGDIDDTLNEIYRYNKELEQCIDVQEPDFNGSNHLRILAISLLISFIIFAIFI